MKRWLIFLPAAALALCLSACFVGERPPENTLPVESSTAIELAWYAISGDWPYYPDAQALADAADLIVTGTVTDVSFRVLDMRTARPATAETSETDSGLYTFYDVEVTEQYKGESVASTQVRVMGGIQDAYREEQAAALGERAEQGIPVLEGAPVLSVGESYLFVLARYEDAAPTLMNPGQSVFALDGSGVEGAISAGDVIALLAVDG